MAFKINVSHNGKTYKVETESEILVGKKIGEIVKGEDVDESLKGYELEITGTSDLSGIPGFKGLEGQGYHRRLLTYGSGMKDTRKGIRLRKSNRGEEISLKTHLINIKVVKEGSTKFEKLVGKKEDGGSDEEEKEEGESTTHKSDDVNTDNSIKDKASESGSEASEPEEVKEEKPVEEVPKEKKEEVKEEEKKE